MPLDLLPTDIAPATAAILVGASFFTSAITAAFGIGGGLALLAIMGGVLPAASLIPVHGIVQLGSNAGRALVFRDAARADFLIPFLIGAAPGAAAGALAAGSLPDWALKLILAGFVLLLVWGPKPPATAGRGAARRSGARRRRRRPCLSGRRGRWWAR